MKDQLTAVIIPFPGRTRAPVELQAPAEAAAVELPSALASLPAATPAPVSPASPLTWQNAQALTSSSQRLTQALTNLSMALADQRDATQRWKAAIEDLAGKMRNLGDVGLGEKKLG